MIAENASGVLLHLKAKFKSTLLLKIAFSSETQTFLHVQSVADRLAAAVATAACDRCGALQKAQRVSLTSRGGRRLSTRRHVSRRKLAAARARSLVNTRRRRQNFGRERRQRFAAAAVATAALARFSARGELRAAHAPNFELAAASNFAASSQPLAYLWKFGLSFAFSPRACDDRRVANNFAVALSRQSRVQPSDSARHSTDCFRSQS